MVYTNWLPLHLISILVYFRWTKSDTFNDLDKGTTIKNNQLTPEVIESRSVSSPEEKSKGKMGLTSNPERTSKVIELLMDWYIGKDGKREGLMSDADLPGVQAPEGVSEEVWSISYGLLSPCQ